MWKYIAIGLSVMFFGHVAHADEHPACWDIDISGIASHPSAMREIAASCKTPAVARLYYNRAHHHELHQRSSFLSRLISFHGDRTSSYRMYMALVESLAPVWFPDPAQRVDALNQEYERVAEVTELRMKGFDRLADALERRAYLQ